MSFEIKSQVVNNYLLITTTGKISDIDEFKQLNYLYFEEFVKNKLKRLIVDEIYLVKPLSLLNMIDLKDYYNFLLKDTKHV